MAVELEGQYRSEVLSAPMQHEHEVQWSSLDEVPSGVPDPIKQEFLIVDLLREQDLPASHSSLRQDRDGGFAADKGFDIALGAFKIDITTSKKELQAKQELVNKAKLNGTTNPVVPVWIPPVDIEKVKSDPVTRQNFKGSVLPLIRQGINSQVPRDFARREWVRILRSVAPASGKRLRYGT